jgi:hypothetical protein
MTQSKVFILRTEYGFKRRNDNGLALTIRPAVCVAGNGQ